MKLFNRQKGFTLVELVLIILLVGVIASVAIRKMTTSVNTAQYEHTKKELDQLSSAIVGNPHVYENGNRVDFGYVGDVGALPPNLDALVQNPGLSTWDGPYMTNGTADDDYKKDAWNVPYSLTGTSIRSTGSGSNIDKNFAPSAASLLSNSLEGYIIDASGLPPGIIYNDSVMIRLTYPNGTGGYNNIGVHPDKSGSFTITSIPIGVHTLSVIYLPGSDTLSYQVSINPESKNKISILFPTNLF